MPRSGGTMTIVNSFSSGTVISSSQVNANFTDIADEITNSLALDGQSTMSGALKAADGTVGAPGITFGGDPDNGAYRTGSNAWSLAVGGAQAIAFATTGLTFPKINTWAKGADIASASTLALGSDGNYFDVTGTTSITAITVAAGTWFGLQFDSALTLTHHSTDLVLPGAANITTATGDRAIFVAEAASKVRCITYVKASGLPIKVDGTIIRMGSDAQGDVLYFNGTNYVRLGAGTSGQFLKTQGAGANPTWANTNTLETAAATTSGSTAGFSSLPTGIKRIHLAFDGVSLSGTDNVLVQLSTGSTFATSGYVSTCAAVASGGASITTSTAGFIIGTSNASDTITGVMTLMHMGSNLWVASFSGRKSTSILYVVGGDVTLGGTLDGIRITRSGTDSFDAGSINILYD